MKTVRVLVNCYVSTQQEIEVEDDFDVNDCNALYDLAHDDFIQSCLLDNVDDCLRENSEVICIEDIETDEVIYEQ